MMRVGLIVFGLLFAFCQSSLAAKQLISWFDRACRLSLQFDPSKHAETSILNTIHVLFGPPESVAPVFPHFEPEGYVKFDFDKLKEECMRSLERVNDIPLIGLRGIADYRHALVDAVNDACEFEAIKIRGFSDPQALRQYRRAVACTRLIDPLEGKSDMTVAVRERVEAQCKQAVSPDQCVAQQFANLKNPFGIDAHVFLLEFGWSNCANQYTLRNADAMRRDQMRTELQRDFRRVFKVREEVGCRVRDWPAVVSPSAAPSKPIATTKEACSSLVFPKFFEEFLRSAFLQKRFTYLPLEYRYVDQPSRIDADFEFRSKTVESFDKVPITFGSEDAKRIVPNRSEMSEEKIHFKIKYNVDGRSRQPLAKVSFNKEESDSFSIDYFFFRNNSCWLLRKIVNNSL